jgi:hypothetical protein
MSQVFNNLFKLEENQFTTKKPLELWNHVTRRNNEQVECKSCYKRLRFTVLQEKTSKTSNIWKHKCLVLHNQQNESIEKYMVTPKKNWSKEKNDKVTKLLLKVSTNILIFR